MHAIVIFFIGLFVLINLFQGTLGLVLFQIGIAFTIPIGIRLLGSLGHRREKEAACNQLEADIQFLKRCHRKTVDPELCRKVGADEATIRKTIRQAGILISMLESYTGQPDQHIEQLFGGHAPSRSQCAAVISDLRYRKHQLGVWLDDTARRDIMITTGKYITPTQVGDEIRRRGAAISAIRDDGSGWAALDMAVAPAAGLLTFFAFEFGLLCSIVYAAVRIIVTLCSNRTCHHGPVLEPSGQARSEYAAESAKRLTDIDKILLGRSATFAAAGKRIGNGSRSARHRRIKP